MTVNGKETLTLLLSALKLRAKDKRADLTEEEEDSIILKEMKQTKEMLDTAPAEREDIIAKAKARLEVLQEFARHVLNMKQNPSDNTKDIERIGTDSTYCKR